MRMIAAAAVSALSIALFSASAFAFSDEPTPTGPGVRSQFADPDTAIDRLANGAAGGSSTEVSTGSQTPSGVAEQGLPPVSAQDAEPVNPNWPAWMVWHQR